MSKQKTSVLDLAEDLTTENEAVVETVEYEPDRIAYAHKMLKALRSSVNGKKLLNSLIPVMSNGKIKFIQNADWFNLYFKRLHDAKKDIYTDHPDMLKEWGDPEDKSVDPMSVKECLEICSATGGYIIPRKGKSPLTARNLRLKSDESEYYIGFTEDVVIDVF